MTEMVLGLDDTVPLPVLTGRYTIERLIGGGGCGLVYVGRHDILGKAVAIKIMRSELLRERAQTERFFRDARLAATLHHENIVDINDFGTDDATGAPYLVMELLRGRTLMDVMRSTGVLPWPRVVGIMLQLARALGCAHGHGVIHRDIKPHNIVIDESSGGDRVKLCDFGLSRLRANNVVSSPAYLAPEQLSAGDHDERCDVHALGVIAYEMLTGELPYHASTPVALVAEIVGDARIGVRERIDGELPDALVELIESCIARDPDNRPASAAEIEQALAAILAMPTRAVTDLVGSVIGSYRVVKPLGSGGSGSVWLAEHPVIGTKVAIKVLRPEVAQLPGVAERFVNEARAAGIVGSPHIARYLDLGWLPSGQPYAVLEYLEGENVFERLRRIDRFAIADAVTVTRQVASAFVLAHEAGIIHRDIKPENIFLAQTSHGELAKVLDFGIAKLAGPLSDSGPRTQVGYFMGTVAFCPPEQVLGDETGPAADVYALGATLFDMLVGEPPFTGDATSIATAKTTRRAPRVREIREDVPRNLAQLVDEMLAMSPSSRPTMAEVVERLAEPPPEVAVSRPRSAAATLRMEISKPGVVLAGIGVAAAIAALVIWLWPTERAAPARPARPAVVAPVKPEVPAKPAPRITVEPIALEPRIEPPAAKPAAPVAKAAKPKPKARSQARPPADAHIADPFEN